MTLGAFDHGTDTRARGTGAEAVAGRWLTRNGYRIVERNYRSKVGEIDVIAVERDTLCFIEVKARATADCGPALEAVHGRKQARIARAASLYLAESGWEGPCRFDVLGMDRRDGSWSVALVQDAFEAPG